MHAKHQIIFHLIKNLRGFCRFFSSQYWSFLPLFVKKLYKRIFRSSSSSSATSTGVGAGVSEQLSPVWVRVWCDCYLSEYVFFLPLSNEGFFFFLSATKVFLHFPLRNVGVLALPPSLVWMWVCQSSWNKCGCGYACYLSFSTEEKASVLRENSKSPVITIL